MKAIPFYEIEDAIRWFLSKHIYRSEGYFHGTDCYEKRLHVGPFIFLRESKSMKPAAKEVKATALIPFADLHCMRKDPAYRITFPGALPIQFLNSLAASQELQRMQKSLQEKRSHILRCGTVISPAVCGQAKADILIENLRTKSFLLRGPGVYDSVSRYVGAHALAVS